MLDTCYSRHGRIRLFRLEKHGILSKKSFLKSSSWLLARFHYNVRVMSTQKNWFVFHYLKPNIIVQCFIGFGQSKVLELIYKHLSLTFLASTLLLAYSADSYNMKKRYVWVLGIPHWNGHLIMTILCRIYAATKVFRNRVQKRLDYETLRPPTFSIKLKSSTNALHDLKLWKK